MGKLKDMVIYGSFLFLITNISMIKTYLIYLYFNKLNYGVFTYEWLIAIIISEIYLYFCSRDYEWKYTFIKLSIMNLFLITLAWGIGTMSLANVYGIGSKL